jgi:hypothetical protein
MIWGCRRSRVILNFLYLSIQAGHSCNGEFLRDYQASEIHFVYPFDPIIYYFLFASVGCMLCICVIELDSSLSIHDVCIMFEAGVLESGFNSRFKI